VKYQRRSSLSHSGRRNTPNRKGARPLFIFEGSIKYETESFYVKDWTAKTLKKFEFAQYQPNTGAGQLFAIKVGEKEKSWLDFVEKIDGVKQNSPNSISNTLERSIEVKWKKGMKTELVKMIPEEQ
jgi:hypothetical protein